MGKEEVEIESRLVKPRKYFHFYMLGFYRDIGMKM